MTSILWRRLGEDGLDRATVEPDAGGFRIAGTALFSHRGAGYDIRYSVITDSEWNTRIVAAHVQGPEGERRLSLRVQDDGVWTMGDEELPALAGARDVDLAFTPAANTVPIRRLALDVGESADIEAAHAAFPDRSITRETQRYERLSENIYRYSVAGTSIDLSVRPDGLVTDFGEHWTAGRDNVTARGAVLKMGLASGFVATALAVGALDTAWGTWLLAGLAASWLGDLALVSKGRALFVAGIAAFTLAHVCYVIAFFTRGLSAPAALMAAAVMAVVGSGVLVWLRPHAGQLFGAVAVYVIAVAAMVAGAVGTNSHETAWLLVGGAVGFAASDVAVAKDRFVGGGSVNRVWGLPAYFVSQFLIAIAAGG